MNIIVSEEIKTVCPLFVGAAVLADVKNAPYNEDLWKEINGWAETYKAQYTTETIKQISAIKATRDVYRACGKDPSRYRPASEALIRRLLRGMDLYKIDVLVDLINLASIAYGYSIGGFDANKIVGDTLTLGVGKDGEPYEGIGRGIINIHGLPVYRDSVGGVGTPTSDNERTKMDLSTTKILAVVNGYDGDKKNVLANASYIQELLRKYTGSDGGEIILFHSHTPTLISGQ